MTKPEVLSIISVTFFVDMKIKKDNCKNERTHKKITP